MPTITKINSFRKERFFLDNNNYPKAHPDGENRLSDFTLNSDKILSIEEGFQGTAFLSKGHNTRVFRFQPTSTMRKYMMLYDNSYAFSGRTFQNMTDADLTSLAQNAVQAEIIDTDFEAGSVDYNDPNTFHNYARLFYKIKQYKPSALTCLGYTLNGPSFGSLSAYGTTRTLSAFSNGSWLGNGMAAFHKNLFNSAIQQINPNYNVVYSDCGNKSLWQLMDFVDIETCGYDTQWAAYLQGEDGVNQNTASAVSMLGALNGIELIKKYDPTKKVRLFGFLKNENERMTANLHSQTTEGSVLIQDKIPISPAQMELTSFMSLWKAWGQHWWDDGEGIATSEDANLISTCFPSGAGQGTNIYRIRYNDGLVNYNQNNYNTLYGTQVSLSGYGHNYDEVYAGSHKYAQIQTQFSASPVVIPATIEFMRSTIDANGNITWPANYSSFQAAQNGSVYADAALNYFPCCEYRQSGSSYAVAVFDLFPNNATNPSKIRVTLGGNLCEFIVWGKRIEVLVVN